MNQVLVLYSSKYGAARQYAEWLKEALSADCVDIQESGQIDFSKYKAVLFGGGVYASAIEGIQKFRAILPRIGAVPAAVFAVGIAPQEDTDAVQAVKKQNMTENVSLLHFFYCRGKMDLAKLKFVHRMMMKMMSKSLVKKAEKERTPAEQSIVEASEKPCDWMDRKYLNPMIEWVESVLPRQGANGD